MLSLDDLFSSSTWFCRLRANSRAVPEERGTARVVHRRIDMISGMLGVPLSGTILRERRDHSAAPLPVAQETSYA